MLVRLWMLVDRRGVLAMMLQSIIDDIIRREGSAYTNHPADKGGPTRYGITQDTLSTVRGYRVEPNEVESLTEEEARKIYLNEYVIRPGFSRIGSDNLAALCVDSGVQHGTERVTRWLQELLGVPVDGIMGPITRQALSEANPDKLFRRLLARRLRFYGEILKRDHSQAVFAKGWLARVAEFIEQA